ncbi:rod shape-determining protein RodA [Conexibacter arvalis]|uniref:peptidoglycan glycosyltransferase n=1 Tax=Conexibacter arvalis TaxID=912552 RepID=A0A840IHW8_9ACTN|nr:rod shape-determining protein RodA [Conexibacter arvalis]MBB4663811.1 rod shape determining protein RodA [Conexibacter arvalis]
MSATPIKRSVDEATRGSSRPRLLFDPLLLIATIGLVVISVVAIDGSTTGGLASRQIGYAVVGAILMIAISRFDYSRLREFKLGVYGLMIALNILPLLLAAATRGARSWIALPFFRFQPSELGKVLLIVALAAFIVDRYRRLGERETTARLMLLALGPAALVMAQPDLGSASVYVVAALTMLFIAGTPGRHIASLIGLFAVSLVLVLAVAPAVGVNVLKPYQIDRLTGFLSPSNDQSTTTYQVNQSKIAIGSGEKTGRGLERSTQTNLSFLPEHHTDFIFSVVGERWGFAGAALVLSLYALLIWRTLRLITMSKNLFGSLIAAGILAMLMYQLLVNVGMTIGIMPITGVTLPLMSYGGSSYLTTFIALGLLQAIHIQARIAQGSKGRGLVLS